MSRTDDENELDRRNVTPRFDATGIYDYVCSIRPTIFFSLAIILVAPSFLLGASPSQVPPVHEVEVVAKQFAFEPAVIRVTAGEPVRLVIRSSDRVHGFAIHDLKIDVRVPRSGNVVVAFTAPRPGRYEIECSEFCGSGHGQMKAALISAAPTLTANQLSKGSPL